MSLIYFPGCKYIAYSPENSTALKKYLDKRFEVTVAGCCGAHYASLTHRDTAVYVCPTCFAILQESAPQAKALSIWELLIDDDQFPWPDYHGKEITLQDCWRTRDHRRMQDAVRAILVRLNTRVIELDASYDRADFCGVSLLKPRSPRYQYLAPIRFIQNAGTKFSPHTEEEQIALMKLHGAQYSTDTVACYCTGCLEGLRIGGVHGVHLMDLVMGAL